MKQEKGRVTQTAMIKRLGLLDSLAGLVFEGDDLRLKCVKAHGSILKSGTVMCRAIGEYEKTGKDVEMRFAKDKNATMLKGVLRSSTTFHQQVVNLKTGFDSLAKSVEENISDVDMKPNPDSTQEEEVAAADGGIDMALVPADAGAGGDGPNDAVEVPKRRVQLLTLELMAVDSPGCFTVHLADDIIVDAMLRHLSAQEEALTRRAKELSAPLATVTGESSWKKDVVDSKDKDAVIEVAASTVVKMPLRGAALGKALDVMSQDPMAVAK